MQPSKTEHLQHPTHTAHENVLQTDPHSNDNGISGASSYTVLANGTQQASSPVDYYTTKNGGVRPIGVCDVARRILFRCNPNDPGYITNGADWYPLYGSMQDYFYFHSTAIDITVELSCCKYPISGKLQQYWMDNKDSFLEFILAAHMGIKGYVIDSVTGEPIQNAVITANKSKDTVSSKDGLFWKLLLPGTYRVKVMASGYNPNVSLIRVKNDNKQSAEIINYWLNPVIHVL
ncbi:hypothetical protein GJ496_002045 [Pomphorhynchus laevis]|nr:hypothetical protein GJ496_002045 [Pomphorhynchus laevis]